MADPGLDSPTYATGEAMNRGSTAENPSKGPVKFRSYASTMGEELSLGHQADGTADDTWLTGGGSQQSTSAPTSPKWPAGGAWDAQSTSSSGIGCDDEPGTHLGGRPVNQARWEANSTRGMTAVKQLHEEARRLMAETETDASVAIATERSQARQVRGRLKEKIQDTKQLIDSLDSRFVGVESAAKMMRESLDELEKAHRAKRPLLNVCERRLELRAGRPEQELVHDHFQAALEHEKRTLTETRQELANQMKNSKDMLAALDAMRGRLLEDLHHKRHSHAIDRCCHTTHKDMVGGISQVGRRPSSARARKGRESLLPPLPEIAGFQLPPSPKGQSVGTGHHHERNRQSETLALVAEAAQLESSAARLANEGDVAMLDAEREAARANAQTEASMVRRIEETQDLRRRLEITLAETDAAIAATEATNAKTKKKLEASGKPLEELNWQFSLRARRSSREGIQDPVSDEMVAQLEALKAAVRTLTQKWQAGSNVAERLREARAQVLEDIRFKSIALKIDDTCAKVSPKKAVELDRKSPSSGRAGSARRRPVHTAGPYG